MKRFRYIFLGTSLCLSLFACSDNEEPKEVEQPAEAIESSLPVDANAQEYKSWEDYYSEEGIQLDMNGFIPTDTVATEMYKRKAKLDKAFYDNYGKLITYNQDSSLFIDPLSYSLIVEKVNGKLTARNAGPDHEVAIVNPETKERTRLLFCGTTCEIQSAYWHNNDMVAIMGLTSENNPDAYTPVIWFVNINNGAMVPYYYNKEIDIEQADKHLQAQLKKKGIDYIN